MSLSLSYDQTNSIQPDISTSRRSFSAVAEPQVRGRENSEGRWNTSVPLLPLLQTQLIGLISQRDGSPAPGGTKGNCFLMADRGDVSSPHQLQTKPRGGKPDDSWEKTT